MAIEKVKEYFAGHGIADRVLEFDVSSATVDLAAAAIGCAPGRIAKTLSFNVNGSAILIVCAGNARIDNPKYKARFSAKAKMLTPDEASALVGHAVGGVCPFGIKEGVKVYLDESLRRFTLVWAACGAIDEVIGLTIPELEALSGSLAWVDVSKPAAPTA